MSGNYFNGDRQFWGDPDFKTTNQIVVYAMLWQSTTTDIAGIHRRNDEVDALWCRLPVPTYLKTLRELAAMGKIVVYDRHIWAKSALWYNLYKGRYEGRQLKAAVDRLKDVSDNKLVSDFVTHYAKRYRVKIDIEIPLPGAMDTPPMGYRSDTEAEAETNSEAGSKVVAPEVSDDDGIPYAEIIDDLNAKADTHFRVTESTKKRIRARWDKGYRLADFQHVHAVKSEEWTGTPQQIYLRPKTLYLPDNFESYLNQKQDPLRGQSDLSRRNAMAMAECMRRDEERERREANRTLPDAAQAIAIAATTDDTGND